MKAVYDRLEGGVIRQIRRRSDAAGSIILGASGRYSIVTVALLLRDRGAEPRVIAYREW